MFELKTFRRGTSPVVYCDTSTREACVHENSVQAVDKNSNRGRASDRTFQHNTFTRLRDTGLDPDDISCATYKASRSSTPTTARTCQLDVAERRFVVCCPLLAGSINTLNACIM